MPDPTVTEARRSVLSLPRMNRDQIVHAISEIRIPDIDLSRLDLSRIELPAAAQTRIAKSRSELAKIDLPKAVAALEVPMAITKPLVAAGIVRPPKPRRWPYALVGVIVAAVIATFIVKQATSRIRTEQVARAARERADAITESDDATFDPLASNGMPHDDVAVAIEPGAFAADGADADAILVFEGADSAV
jgi:hypothetical protein